MQRVQERKGNGQHIKLHKDLLGISAFIGAIVVACALFLGYWTRGIKEILSKLKNLPCELHEKSTNSLERSIMKLENTTAELKNDIAQLPCASHHNDLTMIKTILIGIDQKASTIFSMKASPRKLNETGKKLYNAINGDAFLETNKAALIQYISDNHPMVPLDVEQLSNSACFSLVPTKSFNTLKNYVYNEPTWTLPNGKPYDITVNDLCFVLSLRLRDMYLKEHRNHPKDAVFPKTF